MKRYTGLFKYRLSEIDKLYKAHCAEQGLTEGVLWRLYWLFPQFIALMAATTIFYGVYHLEWFTLDIGEFFGDALIHAIFAFLFTSAVLSFFAVLLSSRHRLDALERAGIAVEESDGPSLRELWRQRHELRRHRLKNHIAWQLARYLGAGFVPAGVILLIYLLPGSTFPEKTQVRQVIDAVIICGVMGGYTFFAVEFLYLCRIYRQIHVAGNDDQS